MGRFLWYLGLLGLAFGVMPAPADVVCDGVDDGLLTASATNVFVGATAGTLTVVVKPTAPPAEFVEFCFNGEPLVANVGGYLGLTRLSNYGGVGEDRMCAYRYTALEDDIVTPYFLDIPVHLAWHHTSDTLSLFADGVLIASAGSGTIPDALADPLAVCHVAGIGAFPGTVAHVAAYAVDVPPAILAATGSSRLYWLVPTVASGDWPFAECADGTSGQSVAFHDHSGSGRSLTGNHGTNAAGLTCQGATVMSYPWGFE